MSRPTRTLRGGPGATAAIPLVELPGTDLLVDVLLADGRVHGARIVAADGYLLTVAATRLAAGVAPPSPGDQVGLRWVGRRGRYLAPCLVRSLHPVQFATWTVEAGGSVEIEQRRRFVRAPATGPIHLGAAEPDLGLVMLGQLLDVGEGGIRCRLVGGGIDPGQPVYVRLALDGELVALTGNVLRLGGAGPDGAVEMVVEFAADEQQAAAIRRYVLHRQRQARMARSDGAG
jgi:hypothetical protein